MKIIIPILILFSTQFVHVQNLYVKTFGNKEDQPILFLHGGPGYNCANFEATTANNLSEKGFYVITYDRRGEGRSIDENALYTFQETFNDIDYLYQTYGLSKSILIGHSFGGIVASLFAERHPEKVSSIILVGAPVSLQESFKTIISTSKNIYKSKNDQVNLNYLAMLENMDTTTIEYSSYCFMHAMQNGFYSPKKPTQEAKNIYAAFKNDTILAKLATQMTYAPPRGFWKNENYTTINLTVNISKLLESKVAIYGLYGMDDGLYSNDQILQLQSLIGKKNLKYLKNCSHSVFMDQQKNFINAVVNWTK